ncbi:RHS repeat domain-containing protein [Pseudomonadota bacterium]
MSLLAGVASAVERVTYYHNDALGSPVAATDAQGNVLWREAYEPYGKRLLKEDGGKEEVWYTGKQEETDFDVNYFGARWYEPSIGRFLSVDPVGVDPGNVHSFNRYAYANNNPYKFVDPDGRSPVFNQWRRQHRSFGPIKNTRGPKRWSISNPNGINRPVGSMPFRIGDGRNVFSKQLKNKMKRINNQTAAGGDRGVSGSVSFNDALRLGREFVGPNFRVMSNKKGWVSEDGLRTFRFPTKKTGVNERTGEPWSMTGRQANFETKGARGETPKSNVHLDVKD